MFWTNDRIGIWQAARNDRTDLPGAAPQASGGPDDRHRFCVAADGSQVYAGADEVIRRVNTPSEPAPLSKRRSLSGGAGGGIEM